MKQKRCNKCNKLLEDRTDYKLDKDGTTLCVCCYADRYAVE